MPDTLEPSPVTSPVGAAPTTRVHFPDDDDPSVPSPRFHDLVMLLEDISKRKNEKKELLHHYFRVSFFFWHTHNSHVWNTTQRFLTSGNIRIDHIDRDKYAICIRTGVRVDMAACTQ